MHLRTTIAIALLAAGCKDSGGDSSNAASSSIANLDDTGTLACNDLITWDSWAHAFFLNNCTSCHSSALQTEEERRQATAGVNFDTYAGVVEYAIDIEYRVWTVAGDPKLSMPPNIKLAYEDRDTLRLWIECGLKEH